MLQHHLFETARNGADFKGQPPHMGPAPRRSSSRSVTAPKAELQACSFITLSGKHSWLKLSLFYGAFTYLHTSCCIRLKEIFYLPSSGYEQDAQLKEAAVPTSPARAPPPETQAQFTATNPKSQCFPVFALFSSCGCPVWKKHVLTAA